MTRNNGKRHKADHRADTRGGRWIGIPHAVVNSEAYVHLPAMERAVLVEIVARLNGYNNGTIVISYRELARRLNRKNEAPFVRAIVMLIAHGLIEIMAEARWKDRRAREYRLTFVNTTDAAGRFVAATNEYLAWRPEEDSCTTDAAVKKAESATTSVAGRSGCATNVVVPFTKIRGPVASRLLPTR
jgi:hypothetical protein